jgi:hypothetical protein
MRVVRRFAPTAIVAAIALVALVAIPKLSTSRALAIWVVVVTALVLFVLVRRSHMRDEPAPARRFEQALRGPKQAVSQPEELLRMERELVLGVADADHAHRRLLPLLRAAAAARLSARHGIELERRPEEARALLGEDVWELLRPDRPEPANRHAAGVPEKRLAAVIERVESL